MGLIEKLKKKKHHEKNNIIAKKKSLVKANAVMNKGPVIVVHGPQSLPGSTIHQEDTKLRAFFKSLRCTREVFNLAPREFS